MKILLVNPPIPNCFMMYENADEQARETFSQRVIVGPPLGLNYVGAVLPDDDIIILDIKAECDQNPNYDVEAEFNTQLETFRPDVVGFTGITAQYNWVKKLLKLVNRFDPDILKIVGGLHATSAPDDYEDSETDLVIIGVGHFTFHKIVEEYKENYKNADFSKIPGLAVKNGNNRGHLHYSQSLKECSYIEFRKIHFPNEIFPNRNLTDKYSYANPIVGKELTYFITSLGCTHKCNFCYLWQFTNGKYYYRNIENIIAELKTLDRFPLIRLCDAHTFGDITKSKELFTRIKEEDLDSHIYVGDVRTDTAVKYPKLMQLAGKSGLRAVVCGLEAYDDEGLAKLGKDNSINNTRRAFTILREAGINVLGNYIIRPDYDERDFERLGRFISDNLIARSNLTILTPFPGTDQWHQMKANLTITNYDYFNLATAVVKTKLPEKTFYSKINEVLKISGKATKAYYEKYNEHLVI